MLTEIRGGRWFQSLMHAGWRVWENAYRDQRREMVWIFDACRLTGLRECSQRPEEGDGLNLWCAQVERFERMLTKTRGGRWFESLMRTGREIWENAHKDQRREMVWMFWCAQVDSFERMLTETRSEMVWWVQVEGCERVPLAAWGRQMFYDMWQGRETFWPLNTKL